MARGKCGVRTRYRLIVRVYYYGSTVSRNFEFGPKNRGYTETKKRARACAKRGRFLFQKRFKQAVGIFPQRQPSPLPKKTRTRPNVNTRNT